MQFHGYAYRLRQRGSPDRWRWEVLQESRGDRVVGIKGETVGPRFQGVKEAERHILMLIQRKRRVDLAGDVPNPVTS
jgi:hypothetical protein